MTSSYSQRHVQPPSRLRYDVPEVVRRRVLAILQHHIGGGQAWVRFLAEMKDLLFRRHGGLSAPSYEAARTSSNPVEEHFFSARDALALDFIEASFQLSTQCGGQKAVDEINAAFRDEGVGYELTKFLGRSTPKGGVMIGGQLTPDQLPRIVRVDEQAIHAQVLAPALSLLTHPSLAVANAEMLKAFSDHRAGRHEDAITACASAFESVLKTICSKKGWSYDSDKDTCAVLVDTCYRNGLFPSFYVELFKRVGTVRNKLGDAHGRGPAPQEDVEAAHAEHMLNITCSHLIFLCRLADLD